MGSIPTGPTNGEGRLQPHPGDVLKSTPNVRKSPRSGLNLEGRVSDPQFFQSSSFTCPISSTSAELRGLTFAQTLIRHVEDTTIVTDSLASLHALRQRHRTDFQYYEEQYSIQPHLDQLVHQLNSKAAELRFGKTLTIAKIPGHAGDPMNEKADDIADSPTRHAIYDIST